MALVHEPAGGGGRHDSADGAVGETTQKCSGENLAGRMNAFHFDLVLASSAANAVLCLIRK